MKTKLGKGLFLHTEKELIIEVTQEYYRSLKSAIYSGTVTAILYYEVTQGSINGQPLMLICNGTQVGAIDYGNGGSGKQIQPIDLTPSLKDGDNFIETKGFVTGNLLGSNAQVIIFENNNAGTPFYSRSYRTDDFVMEIDDPYKFSYSKPNSK